MTTSFNHLLVKAYQNRPLAELLQAPPDALKGVSAADAEALEQAFGISTIRELAENKFFERAQAFLAAAHEPRHDAGPSRDWDAFFATAPIDYYEKHPSGRFRHDFGPVYYRGRLDGTARILIIGQDPATNEIVAQRAFVGNSGQRIQGLLWKMGVTRSYVFVNTFLYSVYGQFDTELRNISLEEQIISYRHAFLDRLIEENQIEAIFAMGKGAQHALEQWPGKGDIPFHDFTHPAALNYASLFANWNEGMDSLKAYITPDEDGAPSYTPYETKWQEEDLKIIPRFDLNFGIPDWHGEGTRASRDREDPIKTITWTAP